MDRTLSLASVVAASPDQMASSVGGEIVILGVKAGRYYGVDGVGARVWQLVQSPVSVAAIRDAIVAEYAVDPARCEADVFALLRSMLDARLIEVQPGSPS